MEEAFGDFVGALVLGHFFSENEDLLVAFHLFVDSLVDGFADCQFNGGHGTAGAAKKGRCLKNVDCEHKVKKMKVRIDIVKYCQLILVPSYLHGTIKETISLMATSR